MAKTELSAPKLSPTSTSPMNAALEAEIIRLERVIALIGAIVCAVGIPLSIYIALFIKRPLGMVILGFSLVLLAWFLFVRACLERGIGARIFQWVNPLIEVSLPTLLVCIDTFTEGAPYAIHQSVPLQLYGIFIAASIVRLIRYMPAVVGAVAGLEYLLTYWVLIYPRLPEALLTDTASRPDMIAIRATLLAVAGGVASLIGLALRRAVSKAAVEVRSKDLFGKYRIEAQLASGGMGTVFRATYCPEGGFRRPVALKRIHPHLAQHAGFVEKFRYEAALSARLLHPNIVQVMDFGRVDDTYFLAMEYVDGMTLLELAQRCQPSQVMIPPRIVAWIGRELCAGLAYAHGVARDEEGRLLRVVHRDLNLPNVLISRPGQIKILDFGVARAMGEARESMTALAVGKTSYMAPEQLEGNQMDTRSDLWGLGVMLWELLCLQPLFSRANEPATIRAVLEAAIPAPSSIRTDLGTQLWDHFFLDAIQRDPKLRYKTADEMKEVLDNILEIEQPLRPEELRLFLETLPTAIPLPTGEVESPSA